MTITSRVKDVVITVAVVIALFFAASFGISCWKDRIIADARKAEAVNAGDQNIATARDTLRIKDSVVVKEKIRWVDVSRDAMNNNPGDSTITGLVQSCDQVIISCENARKAAQVVIDSQAVQIDRLKKFSLPRFSVYARGGYGGLSKQPKADLCGESRLIGVLSVAVCGEGRRAPTTQEPNKIESDVVIYGKINFR